MEQGAETVVWKSPLLVLSLFFKDVEMQNEVTHGFRVTLAAFRTCVSPGGWDLAVT